MSRIPAFRSLVCVCALIFAEGAGAEASLFIYPTTVVFEGNRVSAEVTIANRGDEVGTFEIGWMDMSMTPEGGLMRHDDVMPWSIQPYVRYSPRRVTLAPAESQVIRIAVRRDQDVPEGEYYSHLRVLTLNSAPIEAQSGGAPEPVPGVAITARTAIAIPVIWRNSLDKPAASIASIDLDRESNTIVATLHREGLLSARGFLHVIDPDANGDSRQLSDPVPAILYPNIDDRTVPVPLLAGYSVNGLPEGAELVFSPDESLTDESLVYASRRVLPDNAR